MVKPPLRTKSIGFKVSEEEYGRLETAAQASGRTLGEWCREAILRGGSASELELPRMGRRLPKHVLTISKQSRCCSSPISTVRSERAAPETSCESVDILRMRFEAAQRITVRHCGITMRMKFPL